MRFRNTGDHDRYLLGHHFAVGETVEVGELDPDKIAYFARELEIVEATATEPPPVEVVTPTELPPLPDGLDTLDTSSDEPVVKVPKRRRRKRLSPSKAAE